MLSNQLLSRAEVPRLVANHALLAGHQHVEEVVDHDRHLDAINRGEHTPILRRRPARANAAQDWRAARNSDACSRVAEGQALPCPVLPWNVWGRALGSFRRVPRSQQCRCLGPRRRRTSYSPGPGHAAGSSWRDCCVHAETGSLVPRCGVVLSCGRVRHEQESCDELLDQLGVLVRRPAAFVGEAQEDRFVGAGCE